MDNIFYSINLSTLGDFDPNIFPIPSWALNPQDWPVEEHTVKCPGPQALSPESRSDTEPVASANTQQPARSESGSTTADKNFFMALACLAARRSKDPHRQVRI